MLMTNAWSKTMPMSKIQQIEGRKGLGLESKQIYIADCRGVSASTAVGRERSGNREKAGME